MSSIINSIASAISSSSGSATGSSSRQWKSAAQLALHLLKKNGPTTTQALYKACSATEAPSEKEYRAPGHRDYRIIDGVVRNGTVRPPQPNHLVRSVRFLKLTLQELESAGQIGHAPTAKLIALSENKLASEATIPQEQRTALSEALAEIKQVHERNLAAKESPFVWIDGERWKTLAAAGAGIKRSPKPSKAKRTSRSPRVALGERDREGRSGVYGRRQEASY